jgi:hypothetical protein
MQQKKPLGTGRDRRDKSPTENTTSKHFELYFRYLTGQGKEMKIYMIDREKEGPWRRRNAFPCFIIKTSIDIVTLSIW